MLRWQIRRDGQPRWQPVSVPGCWEDAGFPVTDPGPYWYRTTIPTHRAVGQRLWLRFGAVSYHCTVSVDGHEIGSHIGMWDPFEVEVPGALAPAKQAKVLVQVEKPASLTAGPDSPAVPGRFPLRQTLSGFLPYVWGHAFGGLWQEVQALATGPRRLVDLHVHGTADGRVGTSGKCSAPGPVTVEVFDPDGKSLVKETVEAGPRLEWSGRVPNPQPWSPASPALYDVLLSLPEDGCGVPCSYSRRFGLRTLEAQGATILLNGQPIYPRLALSWGWYPDRRCPNPGPERVRADLLRLRQMGYNGVKLCLWFPPPYYFDLADELGMILWVELPMWLPDPTTFFRQQVPLEYERLVRLARNHPSVLFYTLGCELNRAVDAAFLAELYAQVKSLAGDVLVRDNSGSGEAYGGWPAESADFYDNHFYCDLQFLHPLLNAFAPAWRAVKPWLMGEFCDYDTVRDLPAILEAGGGALPWWLRADPQVNPQGARWEYRSIWHLDKLRQNGLLKRNQAPSLFVGREDPGKGDLCELVDASYRQGLVHRKATLEAVRVRPNLSGYVVTGEADTPISTPGMWDDLGRSKFEPGAFCAFNDDLVLLTGWDRRRTWDAGGDRPVFWDQYSYHSGATVRAHLIASNYTAWRGPARLAWKAAFAGRAPVAKGETVNELAPGHVQELAVAEFLAPQVTHPRQMTLQARIAAGDHSSANTWPLWIYPSNTWAGVAPFLLIDPPGALADLPDFAPGMCRVCGPGQEVLGRDAIVVCTAWDTKLDTFVAAGGRAILLQQRDGPPGPLPVVACPYWREALKLAEPHPAWGYMGKTACDLQLYALAPDCALDASRLPGSSPSHKGVYPLLRRLDTRSLDMHEYAVVLKWGQGRLIATTLRLQGGLGDQPTGISRSPAAAHLLACWLRYLAKAKL
ncbi:MAG: glycoside hydrolase [Anaerolineae bacterium]|nr:glycoside hydrolase [Anaerolineae bacterium]